MSLPGNMKVQHRPIRTVLCFFFSLATSLLLAAGPTAFPNDGVDRSAPDFVKVSLLIFGPGEQLFSVAGHACLRLECPTYKLDYCFSYESEPLEHRILAFFAGKLRMGMYAVPTEEYLKSYREEGRSAWQYPLQLPPDAKQRLWKHLDELAARGAELPYDYIKRGCAWSVLNALRVALPPYQLVYPTEWPEKYKQSRREIFEQGIEGHPWVIFFVNSIVGTEGDRTETNLEKIIMPADLRDFLRTCTVNGVPVLSGEGTEIVPAVPRPSRACWPSPYWFAGALVVLAVVNFFVKTSAIDWFFFGLLCAVSLFYTYLIAFSHLPATNWHWMFVPFNPLPAIFWHWRKYWGAWFAGGLLVWLMGLMIVPCRLTSQVCLVVVFAYVLCFAKNGLLTEKILKGGRR